MYTFLHTRMHMISHYDTHATTTACTHKRKNTMQSNRTNGYAFGAALVSTEWMAQHLDDAGIRLVEVSVDTAAYDAGHIPGAVGWSWKQDTQDTLRRDIPDQATKEDGQ
jgi:Rhodanese-like domain